MAFNKLTDGEIERLALLSEECGECVQAIGKVLRHGWESCHPDGGENNRQLLIREIADVRMAMQLMVDAHDMNIEDIVNYEFAKRCTSEHYLHHNKGAGIG